MNVTIIGLGLIGGSVGKALVRAGWNVGYLDPHVREADALAAAAAHRRIDDIETIGDDELVVFATPVDVTRRLLAKYRLGNVVTTVCSVMGPFSDLARVSALPIVAGHPLAGSAESGFEASSENLFAGHRWFLDASAEQNDAVEVLVVACGGVVTPVDPEEHDRAMAYTSHLPQLISTALASVIADADIDLELFAGSGLRTLLRLAGSDRTVWRPIFESNAEALELAATDFIERVESMLTGDDSAAFTAANQVAETLRDRRQG